MNSVFHRVVCVVLWVNQVSYVNSVFHRVHCNFLSFQMSYMWCISLCALCVVSRCRTCWCSLTALCVPSSTTWPRTLCPPTVRGRLCSNWPSTHCPSSLSGSVPWYVSSFLSASDVTSLPVYSTHQIYETFNASISDVLHIFVYIFILFVLLCLDIQVCYPHDFDRWSWWQGKVTG